VTGALGPHPRIQAGHDRQSAQALIETAVTMPILVILFIGFLAAGVGAQGYVDLNMAVSLAAASNATAFADDPEDAFGFASDTYTATLRHDSLLRDNGFDCDGTNYAAGGKVVCTGSAVLEFSRTPLAIVIVRDPTISATATATRSPYRSTKPT
jgi:hypothetical protein